MSEKSSTFFERLCLFLLISSFLVGLGLVQWRRQRPSLTLKVLSDHPPTPVPAPTLSLNLATAEELTRLPGVGPRLAERIVGSRNQRGPFTNTDELLKVKGVGPALYKRLTPYLRLE